MADRLFDANGHLYAYVMNNYWFTNCLAGQGGDFTFRFAITSRPKADNVASARFGWEVASPLQAIATGVTHNGRLPSPTASLIEIAESNVLLVGMKRADADQSLVLRLWEVTGQGTVSHVRHPLVPFQKARAANLVEQPKEPLEARDSAVAVPLRARPPMPRRRATGG